MRYIFIFLLTVVVSQSVFVVESLAASAVFETVRRHPTLAEIADGVPMGLVVNEGYVSTDSDIQLIELDSRIGYYYQAPLGSDYFKYPPEVLAAYPSLTADTYLTTPGNTQLFGNFDTPGSLWGDLTDDGPVMRFKFAQYTTTTGKLIGTMTVGIGAGRQEFDFGFGYSFFPDTSTFLRMRYNDPADITEGGTWMFSVFGPAEQPDPILGARFLISGVDLDPTHTQFNPAIDALDAVDIGSGPRAAVVESSGVLDVVYQRDLTNAPYYFGEDGVVIAEGVFGLTRPAITMTQGITDVTVTLLDTYDDRGEPLPLPHETVASFNQIGFTRGDSVALDGLKQGDANRDRQINDLDRAIVLAHKYQPGGWDEGDFDDSGFVDINDLRFVGIPEPSSIYLCVVGTMLMFHRKSWVKVTD